MSIVKIWTLCNCEIMSGSCHLDGGSNVEIGVECQIFVIDIFLTAAEFYNLVDIQGKGALTQKWSFLVLLQVSDLIFM